MILLANTFSLLFNSITNLIFDYLAEYFAFYLDTTIGMKLICLMQEAISLAA